MCVYALKVSKSFYLKKKKSNSNKAKVYWKIQKIQWKYLDSYILCMYRYFLGIWDSSGTSVSWLLTFTHTKELYMPPLTHYSQAMLARIFGTLDHIYIFELHLFFSELFTLLLWKISATESFSFIPSLPCAELE